MYYNLDVFTAPKTYPTPYLRQAEEDLAQALLSLDRFTIECMAKAWGLCLPLDPHTFWLVVHKARAALPTISREEQLKSREWLIEHGYTPLT